MDFITTDSNLVTIVLGFIAVVLIYRFSKRNHHYWKDRKLPYVKSVPFFGTILPFLRRPAHEVETERYKKYGAIYGHFEGNKPLLSVADPALLKDILVKDFQSFTSRRKFSFDDAFFKSNVSTLEGEDWKRVRSIITPTFTTGKIKRMLNIFKDCANTCTTNFMKFAESGKPVDLRQFYNAFTTDTIASSAFSTKVNSHNDPKNKFVQASAEILSIFTGWRALFYMFAQKLQRIFKFNPLPPKSMNYLNALTLQMIEERKRTGQKRNDYLQLLLDIANENEEKSIVEKDDLTDNYGKEETNHQIFKNIKKKTLSQNELLAQCVVFFVAGFDATSLTLCFASYLLALYPDIQEKLIAELDEVLRATNGELTYDAIQSMKYLDNVISETLRMFPPAMKLERTADDDYVLRNTGIVIPKDMTVTIPIYAIHRDPKFFPDPEKFYPDRFNPEERAKREQCVYMPFGYGPRNCIAMRFILMSMKVCLATLLSNFRFKKCPETQVPLEFKIGLMLLQPKTIYVRMEERKDTIKAK